LGTVALDFWPSRGNTVAMRETDIPESTVTIQVPIDLTVLLSAVWDNLDRSASSWIAGYAFNSEKNDGTECVTVMYDNPGEGAPQLISRVCPEQLLKGFEVMVGRRIWGATVSADPEDMDALQADYCLQMALFGEEVYN